MSLTRTTYTSATLALAILVPAGVRASSQETFKGPSENRIVRPEGFIELEGDAGASGGKGAFSVVPGTSRETKPPASTRGSEEDSQTVPGSEEQFPPPPAPMTPREACQPQADRFAKRLAVLRGNPVDGGEVLDPAIQRAMFGRTALHGSGTDPDQPVPELTWDDELKDLHRAYEKCLKAAHNR